MEFHVTLAICSFPKPIVYIILRLFDFDEPEQGHNMSEPFMMAPRLRR